jgi:flavin reductase (DIM6/NTAB) family NADH-FMN oxidoreductase RutF
MCLVTTGDAPRSGLEKVVGASVVNRFPYVLALSFCRQPLSPRHHERRHFMARLEECGQVAVQLLPPGGPLDRALAAVLAVPDEDTNRRTAATGLATSPARSNSCPVFDDAYLVYEAKLVGPGRDFSGRPIHQRPWRDVGSHRIYFLEINAIQLQESIARAERQIHWRSLPCWQPQWRPQPQALAQTLRVSARYQKGYSANYLFPSAQTVAFEADEMVRGRAVKHLPTLAGDQVETDNDRARWPCFFPSSVGLITCQSEQGTVNVMPCGSTTVVSRHPLVIAPCVSYAAINDRYAPRASLDLIRRARRFGCGVPYIADDVLAAIRYAGTVSLADDPDKVRNAGLTVETSGPTPRLLELPIHYDCALIDEVHLGTHAMLLGEVRRIRVRTDVTPGNPVRWVPWPDVVPSLQKEIAA